MRGGTGIVRMHDVCDRLSIQIADRADIARIYKLQVTKTSEPEIRTSGFSFFLNSLA